MAEPTGGNDGANSVQADDAQAFAERFRQRIRAKLTACGPSGEALERAVEDLMMRDIGFRFDLKDIERL